MADDSKLSVAEKKLIKCCTDGDSKGLAALLEKKANPNAAKVLSRVGLQKDLARAVTQCSGVWAPFVPSRS